MGAYDFIVQETVVCEAGVLMVHAAQVGGVSHTVSMEHALIEDEPDVKIYTIMNKCQFFLNFKSFREATL